MKKRLMALLLAASLSLSMTACTDRQGTEKREESQKTQSTQSTQSTEKKASERPTKDMAGRELKLPEKIEKVYSSSPIGTSFMYTFDDKMVAGVNVERSEEELKFVTDYYKQLPNLGGWFGRGNEGNVEEIIKNAPDIVLSSGTDKNSVSTADELQEKLGIPVVLIDTDFDAMADSYRFLGKLLENEERGETLGEYTEKTIQDAQKMAAEIPENEKVTVYYAEEQTGLMTDPSGSQHARLIDLCGGINVAECEISPGYGRTEVSMEQVIAWNPEYIICCVDNGYEDSGSYQSVLKDSQWSVIQAVKDGHVYETPALPQNWFDRPPSANTIIGVKWVQSILYPDRVDFNMEKEVKKFYSLFYHYELTDDDVDFLLKNAM